MPMLAGEEGWEPSKGFLMEQGKAASTGCLFLIFFNQKYYFMSMGTTSRNCKRKIHNIKRIIILIVNLTIMFI